MSWVGYVDNLIGHSSGHTSKAAIIGLDGSLWTPKTQDNVLDISASEAVKIAQSMKSKDMTNFQRDGILLEGNKFQFLRSDDNFALGKKKDVGGITLQSSKTAVVIGFTPDGKQAGSTNKAVGVIAEYLESLGM